MHTWWRHQVEIFSALLAICAGNSPVTGEFPTQRPVTRSFDVFFDLRPNKRLSKHWWGWWFETPSRSLWRHCNGTHCIILVPLSLVKPLQLFDDLFLVDKRVTPSLNELQWPEIKIGYQNSRSSNVLQGTWSISWWTIDISWWVCREWDGYRLHTHVPSMSQEPNGVQWKLGINVFQADFSSKIGIPTIKTRRLWDCLYNGDSYIGKTASLYWIDPLIILQWNLYEATRWSFIQVPQYNYGFPHERWPFMTGRDFRNIVAGKWVKTSDLTGLHLHH